jgi:serine/threonine protein phosphatase PrpC
LTKNENTSTADHITSSFTEVDNSLIGSLRDSFKSFLTWPMPRSVRQKAIDAKLKRKELTEIALRARSGSTALVAVVDNEYITFGSVGDCRAGQTPHFLPVILRFNSSGKFIFNSLTCVLVLGHSAQEGGEMEVKVLTVDQNGDNETERERMLKEHPSSESQTLFAGGRLFGHTSVTRCELPNTLSLSCLLFVTKFQIAFGDVFFKEPNTAYAEYVFGSAELTSPGHLPFSESMARFYPLIKTPPYLTAMPEITRHRRSSSDRFLIIASDGVWGVKDLTDEWAVKTIREGVEKGVNAAEYMVGEVKKFHPGDDVTIMVIVFSANEKGEVSDDRT